MISQFVSPYQHRLLGDLSYPFPEGTHAVGRLDEESEGLLILTTDKKLTRLLLHPSRRHKRHYMVQVEKKVEEAALQKLRQGVEILIKTKGKYQTQPCEVNIIPNASHIPARLPELKTYGDTTWLEFVLTEGKNRQIRKMCNAVRHNCKRLIRTKIENLELGDLKSGEVREIKSAELFELLQIRPEHNED